MKRIAYLMIVCLGLMELAYHLTLYTGDIPRSSWYYPGGIFYWFGGYIFRGFIKESTL
jgi:predicted membrane channel-forming protein YqfA (hemolysin III family)